VPTLDQFSRLHCLRLVLVNALLVVVIREENYPSCLGCNGGRKGIVCGGFINV
jgi:hypothetical protein